MIQTEFDPPLEIAAEFETEDDFFAALYDAYKRAIPKKRLLAKVHYERLYHRFKTVVSMFYDLDDQLENGYESEDGERKELG